jgi:hypothetical protein
MGRLRIEICNERLLPRFGVDRLLVLLAQHLVGAGCEIGFVCLRCDEEMLRRVTPDITVIPVAGGLDMQGTESAATCLVLQRWQQRRPDAIVIGGWPFFELAARAGSSGVASVFIDAGAVAQDALPETLLNIQRELRRIRQSSIPFIDRVLPISEFIRKSQTEPDRGNRIGVETVLLGADHMHHGTFGANSSSRDSGSSVEKLRQRVERGERLLLSLGRFESGGYKNSSAVYAIFRTVLDRIPECRLLLLDAGQDCSVPKDLA